MDQVDGMIIGITCFFVIFVLLVLSAIAYKKRKSFKDIIVTKATVAKSNSYKSNVGGTTPILCLVYCVLFKSCYTSLVYRWL